MSRPKKDCQQWFRFQGAKLKITERYYSRYERIGGVLDDCPEILNRVHGDLMDSLEAVNQPRNRSKRFRYTSEHVLRCVIVSLLEGLPLRDTVVRVDDSDFLRRFTRIEDGPMMDFTTLDRLRNAIRPETWKRVNDLLAAHAVNVGRITGDALRMDTTAVETNIHWPSDSGLLWDSYRTLVRLLEHLRSIDPRLVGDRRFRLKTVKRRYYRIARLAKNKADSAERSKLQYSRLIRAVEGILRWSEDVGGRLRAEIKRVGTDSPWSEVLSFHLQRLERFQPLIRRVIDQATRRVLRGESVPNHEKLFSIFEPHTELLIRGKAGKDVEFGHMVGLQQVEEKFITAYEVFPVKPVEHCLVGPALESHKRLFGKYPDQLTADKGYWESPQAKRELEAIVPLVAIGKKGKRDEEEDEQEHSFLFRMAQRFRAGIEGTISYLKRSFRLNRCVVHGFKRYRSTVGAAVFVHNLLVLVGSSGEPSSNTAL